MRQLFSKTDLQAFSSVLAFVLLLSTIPLTSGVVMLPGLSHPEVMINICQPAQILSHTSNSILARPSVKVPQFVLFLQGSFKATPAVGVVERNVTPNTPPPKTLA
jgi:hypothetical protein